MSGYSSRFGSGVILSIKPFWAICNIGKNDQSFNSRLTFTYTYVTKHNFGSVIINHFVFLFPPGSLRAETIFYFCLNPIYSFI